MQKPPFTRTPEEDIQWDAMVKVENVRRRTIDELRARVANDPAVQKAVQAFEDAVEASAGLVPGSPGLHLPNVLLDVLCVQRGHVVGTIEDPSPKGDLLG